MVSGNKEELKAMITTSEKVVVSFTSISDEELSEMKGLPHVIDIERDGEEYIIKFESGINNLTKLLEFIKGEGADIYQAS